MLAATWTQWASLAPPCRCPSIQRQSSAHNQGKGRRLPSTASQTSPESRHRAQQPLDRPLRQAAFALLAASVLSVSHAARALPLPTQSGEEGGDSPPPTVYFGNGCFWGRQKDFVDTEKQLGRQEGDISATVGYAGGANVGRDGLVCYYYGPRDSVYESLGHAEVTQLELSGKLDSPEAKQQMTAFADAYFKQFRRTPFGMIRLDPQDAGAAYRNIIGLPGGTSSPLFRILQDRNVHKMELLRGDGNDAKEPAREGDKINRVYVVDSAELPFHKAELYHQYHNGIGHPFPRDYTQGQKQIARKAGRIGNTGCPEL